MNSSVSLSTILIFVVPILGFFLLGAVVQLVSLVLRLRFFFTSLISKRSNIETPTKEVN